MIVLAWQQVPPPRGQFPGGGMPQHAAPQLEWWENPAIFALLLLVALYLLFFALFSTITAVQAKRRGYSFVAWLFAGILGNPIFLLVLLGVMPDFRRRRLRQKEADDLRRRLRRRRQDAEPPAPQAKEAAPARAVRPARERSLGDESTRDLPERSLGDDETRL